MSCRKIGILVAGGPAPGINPVIAAATIRCCLEGAEVFGISDGFRWLMDGRIDKVTPLTIDRVSRIHFRGGSTLGTSRSNPTSDPAAMQRVLESIRSIGLDGLITIGGDDTAFSAMSLAKAAGDSLQVVHVPKTIDNDLDLPPQIDTFGYQTARHVGVGILQNLMVDARTTGRWYVVVAMGRKAGHLALGMGKASGSTLTLIPEEFGGRDISLSQVVDTLVAAIIKRRVDGRADGIAVVAEGVGLCISEKDLQTIGQIQHDEHGHLRMAEINLAETLQRMVQSELESLGCGITIVHKDIGYELRSADPIPFDIDYTRDLGYCAAKYLIEGGTGSMVSMQGGRFVPMDLESMLDPATGRLKVRMVDITSERYGIARRYMIRLRRDDFTDPEQLERLASECSMTVEAFKDRFEPLIDNEPPALRLMDSS